MFRLLLMALLLAVLAACGDSTETESRKLFDQAKAQVQQGQPDAAEQTLKGLLETYPQSQVAAEARQELAHLGKLREAKVREAAVKVLDSYYQVLSGYKAMFGQFPASVQELDGSGYFFDSDYLAELTPANIQVYLWLAADGSTFKVLCLQQGQEVGYQVDHQSHGPQPLGRAELRGLVDNKFQAQLLKGSLSLLTPKG